ncbi:MAG: CaiB/BaiF CoA transferase family protein [Dehalococcoidia bacterium]
MSLLPLEGIRVIDLTRYWAGPFGTQFLAFMGAEVIRVESALYIDAVRYMIPPAGEPGERPYNQGSYFHMANRNKYSISLDLQQPEGKELFLKLVSVGDVVMENFSARVMGNLGLEYETLRGVRPDVIVVSMPSFGGTGPYRDYVCFGEALEGMTGLTHLTGYADGPPMRSSGAFTDPVAGLQADYAVLAALQHRNRMGQGCYLDLSHQEGYVTLLGDSIMDYSMNGRVRTRIGNRHPFRAPQGVYPCRGEDRWIAISVASDEEWQGLCRAMGRPELASDPRFGDVLSRSSNHQELDTIISDWTRRHDHYEVMGRLQEEGVAGGVVLAADELFEDPHFKDRGFWEELDYPDAGRFPHFGIPIKFSRTPGGSRTPAPLFAQHNRYVFEEVLGLSGSRVDELLKSKVVADRPVQELETLL